MKCIRITITPIHLTVLRLCSTMSAYVQHHRKYVQRIVLRDLHKSADSEARWFEGIFYIYHVHKYVHGSLTNQHVSAQAHKRVACVRVTHGNSHVRHVALKCAIHSNGADIRIYCRFDDDELVVIELCTTRHIREWNDRRHAASLLPN